jgi:hypothetical protein
VTKRALSVAALSILLCLPLFAQQTYRPSFSALNNSLPQFPSLDLANAQSFSFPSAFSWIEPTTPNFLPALTLANVSARSQRTTRTAVAVRDQDSSKEVVDVRRALFDYATGEVGFLYGRSAGKYSAEVEQGYIMGEVGNDKFQISAGAAYEHASGRVPRFRH